MQVFFLTLFYYFLLSQLQENHMYNICCECHRETKRQFFEETSHQTQSPQISRTLYHTVLEVRVQNVIILNPPACMGDRRHVTVAAVDSTDLYMP